MTPRLEGRRGSVHLTDRLSIRQRLIGAIALIMGLFGLACVTGIVTFADVREARVFSDRMDSLLRQTDALSDGLLREQGALRGYVLAGAPRYRQSLADAGNAIDAALAGLDAEAVDDAEQQQRLQRIRQLQARWRTDVVRPILAEVDAGRTAAAQHRLVQGDSVSLFDPMRDALAAFRTRAQDRLQASTMDLDYRQRRARWLLLGVLLFGLLVGLWTVRAIVRRVTRPLTRLTETTRRLAEGERDVELGYRHRGDEIGAVSRALERFRQGILEQDRQAWIRDHRARIGVLLQRCEDQRALGDCLLAELAPVLGAGYMALFTPASLAEEERDFDLLCAWGYDPDATTRFSPGEGLVGQAVVTGEAILRERVPEHFLAIRSGLGAAAPSVLLVMPVKNGEHVVAVLEVALFERPGGQAMELLETLLPNVALGLVSHARSRRTSELLAQSRAQTGQLQESEQRLREQQQALRQANGELRVQSEELNAQSEALRASEEELKVQAEQLQATNEELRNKQELMGQQQQELSRLHGETQQRAEALAQASRYKSEFLANMSHELRTPLNSLLILSRSLADNDEGNLDAEQIEVASIIHESGSHLLALINDILDLSKIEAGKMRLSAETLEVKAFARRIERHFSHLAQDKGLDLAVTVADDAPAAIVTDAGKLEQVVGNLVGNALKFTDKGRIQVDIEAAGERTTFRNPSLTPHAMLAIHVADDGIGIPADRLEQIFQAFEQVDASTSRTYGGTGLGLSISRELARLLGGEIAVDSRLGEGSRFSVYVSRALAPDQIAPQPAGASAPVTPDDAMPADVALPAEIGSWHAPHLLIIDDDRAFTNAVARAARKHGFECRQAADGQTGLDMVRQQLPDAIVLDLGLPGMDGWAVLDRLKASERTRDIPVHIVSASDDPGRSQQAGAVGYLHKPISRADLDVLFARAEALSGRSARRVLIVDDDRDAHTVIQNLLRAEAVEIVSVERGDEAMARLDAQRFDCVVLDLHLPDISGFELLERIAARDSAPPVVVYSARELSEAETRQLRAHTDSIVIKGTRAQERLLDEISLFFARLTDRRLENRRDRPAPDAVKEPAAVYALPEGLAGRTVLLVDDDMRNTFALSRVLRARQMHVVMAADGFQALAQIEARDDISIVLMDIMMPGMDGFEAIRRIRARQVGAELPIIALTAKAMAGDREQCLAAGANAYLPKPLDTEALIDRMQALL